MFMKGTNLDVFYQAEPFTIHQMPKKQVPRKAVLALAAAQLPDRDLSEQELNTQAYVRGFCRASPVSGRL